MGGTYSSPVPVALDELTQPYIVTPRLTRELYIQHLAGQLVDQDPDHPLLTHVPPELLGRVSLHKSLDLSFNLIEEIPQDLPLNLPHLTVLNLSHNRIQTIPESLFGFIHLKLLDLSFNEIESVPSIICLFHELRKLDISHNKISKIPSSINNLKRLEKMNISSNSIEHLPLSLGNIPSLQVLLASNNPLPIEIREANSQDLLDHLRTCYASSLAVLPADHVSLGNSWTRVRGSVFDSTVLNSGSAQSLFEQMQAQAVNTGNRLLTPLIPPTNSTTLKVDRLRDTILGIFYGAAIGDSLGFLTSQMSADEAEFHYSRRNFDQSQLFRDEYRSDEGIAHGHVTPAMKLSILMLDSVMKWAGVVDELDFAEKLVEWYQDNGQHISSQFIHSLMKDKSNFLIAPGTVAKQINENNSDHFAFGTFDNICLPSMIGISVTQFHDISEVESNARRICSSTHSNKHYTDTAAQFAKILAQILQGKNIQELMEVSDTHGVYNSLKLVKINFEEFDKLGFKEVMMNIVMLGGEAACNGLVAGAIFGALAGFQSLPSQWILNINKEFMSDLDKKVNNLFDLMGIP